MHSLVLVILLQAALSPARLATPTAPPASAGEVVDAISGIQKSVRDLTQEVKTAREVAAVRDRAEPRIPPSNRVEMVTATTTIISALVGVGTIVLLLLQTRATQEAAKAAQSAAVTARDALVLTERAALHVSYQPPGLTLGIGDVSLVLKIKNVGKTQAEVLNVRAIAVALADSSELPKRPDYSSRFPQQTHHAFLVAGDGFDVHFTLPYENDGAFNVGKDASHRVHIVGYVDYIDLFGSYHRTGYAKVHDPYVDEQERYPSVVVATARQIRMGEHVDWDRFNGRQNLSFITRPGYNYDRRLTDSERQEYAHKRPC